MRAVFILALLARVAAADAPRATPIGFDHTVHDRDVVVSGAESLPCERCHTMQKGKLVGRPGHAACFGACHAAPAAAPKRGGKIAIAPDAMKLCTNCHAEAVLVAPYTGTLAVAYPPYTIDPDFGVALGHRQHAQVACTQCHAEGGTPKQRPAPHTRCAGCHDGSGAGHGPPMTRCAGCHPAAVGRPVPIELAALHDTISSTFSHGKHAARGAAGKECTSCHAAIKTTDDTELPRPTVKDCAHCHDGKQAFASTAACTRCHEPPADRFTVARPTARFSHGGVHADAVAKQNCASCHPLASNGEALVASHGACVACHTDDFGARDPKICGACHTATEPWRHLVADRGPADHTEFGATLDHAKHGKDCTDCHTLRTATSQLRTSRGHGACTGRACHAITGGPAPQLTACTSCHAAGRADAREAARAADPWSVRGAFDHGMHQVACTRCHLVPDLAGADVVALPTPAKATCAPCHDGTQTFSLTGTTCTRCHAGGKKSP